MRPMYERCKCRECKVRFKCAVMDKFFGRKLKPTTRFKYCLCFECLCIDKCRFIALQNK